ncbi:MAG: zinc ribbon domain-containing protein [Candidatus Caldarchaeum sp.]
MLVEMRGYLRLAAATVLSFAIAFILIYLENIYINPLHPAIISILLTASAAGLVARASAKSALAAAVGGLAAFALSRFLNFSLWSPSQLEADLFVSRLLLIGGATFLAGLMGYVAGNVFAPKPVEAEKPVQPTSATQKIEQPPTTPPPPQENVQQIMKICKFCSSVIPGESRFCPMCGAKLIETGEESSESIQGRA